MYDVAIIGAGVIGGMIARTLAKYKLKICLLEKENDVAMGATCANSAIVHAGFDAKEGSLKAQLNVLGSKMMKEVTEELGVKYQNNGSLVVGFSLEDQKMLEQLYERGVKNGVKGLKVLTKEELNEKEPNISKNAVGALFAPTGAIVCPYELTIAAVGNAMDNGADLKRNFKVSSIICGDDYYEIVSDAEVVVSRYVINAAGIYSDQIAGMIGDHSFSVHPRKGEYILLDKECGKLVSHTIFGTPNPMGKGVLVSPTVDGNLLMGPTSEDILEKEDKSTTREGFSNIIKGALKKVDGIQLNQRITSFCGLRAAGNTGDFIITSPKRGFINAAGIESPGLSASPAIAEYVVTMLKGQGLALKINPDYQPRRKPMHYFKEASQEEKNAIIQKNKAFGRVICRCETVTEGEILEAIHTNPGALDLDGIKRRTRAQMGRCQGGFCMPYVIELISRELGIPYEKVTKFGGNSCINQGKTKEEGYYD